MVIMNNLLAAAPVLTNIVGKLILWLNSFIGNFGWTVVIFTLILKTALMPLDIWQKKVTVKNNNAMKKMKPQLDKLQKQYGANREMYGAKQMELYKKEGYSLFGSCLPMVFTLVIFIVIFQGFYASVRYQNETITYELAELSNAGATDEELADAYGEKLESWLWIKNIYMPDTIWSDVIPNFTVYSGSKLGQLKAQFPDNFNQVGDYDALVKPAMDRYNPSSFWDYKNWNGLLLLPLLAIIMNFLTTVLMKNSQPVQPTQLGPNGQPMNNAATMKIMQYMMPLMIGIFSLFYSSAFTLYLFVSAVFTGAFNLIFNIINTRSEKKQLALAESTNRR